MNSSVADVGSQGVGDRRPLTLIALFLMARFTVWGRQYWQITGDYFRGRSSIKVWIWLGVLLLSVMISVRINVLISFFSNDLYTSLQVAFEATSAKRTPCARTPSAASGTR